MWRDPGGGFGGLAAAAYLIRNAGMSGQDSTIYEADERMGGGFSLGGSAASGYSLPGSVFDAEFRCTFDLLQTIPSLALLAMLIPLLGRIGTVPALVALTLYALLPIARNTATGLAGVPRRVGNSTVRSRTSSRGTPGVALTGHATSG